MPQTTKIRELRTTNLGKLICIYGTVTRTTDAKPELILGTFKCETCGQVVQNVEQQFKYTKPTKCINKECNNRMDWELVNKESTLIDW